MGPDEPGDPPVISFGMTAVVVLIALGAYLESETDRVDMTSMPQDLDPDEISFEEDDSEPGLKKPRGDYG